MEEESGGSSTASPSCFIHFQGKTGDLLKLTCHTLVKIKEYCLEWINLEGEPKEIAEKIIDVVRTWPDSESNVLPTEAVDFRYNKECYVRFCDKTKVARCIKKKRESIRTKCKRAKDTKIALRKTFLYQIGINCIRFRINEFNHRKAKYSCPSRTVHHM